MSDTVDELALLHLQKQFSMPGWGDFYERLVRVREGLSPQVKTGLQAHSRLLLELLERAGSPDSSAILRDLSCLVPGAQRGRPGTLQRIWFDESGQPSRHMKEAFDFWVQAMERVTEYEALTPTESRRLASALGAAVESGERVVDALLTLERRSNAVPGGLNQHLAGIYRTLSPEGGRRIATHALGLLDRGPSGFASTARLIFKCLACLVPGALQDVQPELAKRGICRPGYLFRGAGADSREALRSLLLPSASGGAEPVLGALAWIGDAEVQTLFADWRRARPDWAGSLLLPVEAYADEGGWELTSDGGRRELCSAGSCVRLSRGLGVEGDNGHGAAAGFLEHEDTCGWCGDPLVSLIDLDLSDLALSFLALGKGRLRIPMCARCTTASTTYSDVNLEGSSRWSVFNAGVGPERRQGDPGRPRSTLVIGAPMRTPVEAHASWFLSLNQGSSQVGGHPLWLQDRSFPPCPRCRRSMAFIAQVDGGDLEDMAEGTFYAFVCSSCGVGAVNYQQT